MGFKLCNKNPFDLKECCYCWKGVCTACLDCLQVSRCFGCPKETRVEVSWEAQGAPRQTAHPGCGVSPKQARSPAQPGCPALGAPRAPAQHGNAAPQDLLRPPFGPGASWARSGRRGRPGPAPPRPTRVRARPSRGRSSAGGSVPELNPHQPRTSLSLQHLEIRKALRETSWKLCRASAGASAEGTACGPGRARRVPTGLWAALELSVP